MGQGSARIARALGVREGTIQRLVRGDAHIISPPLRDAISDLYDAWWDKRCPCRKRRSCWSSGVLVLVDDASGPVVSPDPEGLEVGYLGWKRLERCGAG